MLRSTDRILVTHAGALPRSEEIRKMVFARAAREPFDEAEGARIATRKLWGRD